MVYRITFGFSGAGVGWAETHAILSPSNNPIDLLPIWQDIATKRAQMLGREFAIVGGRISRYATDAGVRTRGVYPIKQRVVNAVQTASAGAEPAAVALLVRGIATPSVLNPQFDANTNQSFLGAPLDVSVDDGGIVYEGRGGLGTAFSSWRSAVVSAGMGWLASETILNAGVSGWIQNGNGTVNFVADVATVPPLVVGQWYRARIRQVNGGVSPLNGEVIVRANLLNGFTTREVIGLALAQEGGFIRVYKQVQPFIDYGNLTLGAQVGKHKRGRPYGSSPGRARRRIRG